MADSDKPEQTAQPGQVITPGSVAAPPEPAAPATSQSVSAPAAAEPPANDFTAPREPVSPPAPSPAETEPSLAPPSPTETPQQDQANQQAPPLPSPTGSVAPISWTASEFVAHEKNFNWYAGLIAIAAVVSILIYMVTRDVTSSVVVVVCALALGVLANRKPRQLQYALSESGITIGNKHFDYGAFKSFSVVPEGAFSSVVFIPLKRFAPPTTIYYAPEDEDRILDILSNVLPLEEHKPDAIDSIARRVRF